MINKKELGKFLEYTVASKDVSLVVVKDEVVLGEFRSEMVEREYKDLKDIRGLMELAEGGGSGFLVVDGEMEKEVYDFVVQYPTGQVEVWEKEKNSPMVVNPKYEGVAILLLMTEGGLEKVGEQGFELLGCVGLTYRE